MILININKFISKFYLPFNGCVAMVESLYQEYRRSHPERFEVGWNKIDRKKFIDLYDRPEGHTCFGCIVKKMNPKDCDYCDANPVKELMKKAGLL